MQTVYLKNVPVCLANHLNVITALPSKLLMKQ